MLVACGGGDGHAPPASEGQATIDATGGVVPGPDGVTLTVPPAAVASGTTFRIARNATGAPMLIGMTLLSPVYEVTPHGTAFDLDALLTLPYDATKAPAGATPVVLRGEPDGSWHVQPVRSGPGSTALIDVGNLSWYAVGVCTPGDAGTFGFGIGDCPANSEFKLEYLDGSGVAVPVARAVVGGYALPFPQTITAPTDVSLRLTWSRPAGVDRVDTVRLYGASTFENFQQDTNEQIFTRDVVVHIDPTQVQGAAAANGVVKHYFANAFYCFQGFVIGLGNQTVCWNFDTDLAFRVHDTSSPGAPVITSQPNNRDVVQAQAAVFSVSATVDHAMVVTWERLNPANSTWIAANTTAVFPSGGTQTYQPPVGAQPGSSTFTIASTALADDKARLRARVCDVEPSASQTCLLTNEVVLGVVPVNAVYGFPVFTQQPQSAGVLAGQTYSVTVAATGYPSPDIVISQIGAGIVKACPNPGQGAHSNTCNYTTAPLALGDSGTQFVADASSGSQFTTHSQTATVTVSTSAQPVTIASTDPADVSVSQGSPATFTVSATGTAPLNYQWFCDAGPVNGANGASLTLLSGQAAYFDGALCYVVVTNPASPGGVTSRSALLSLTAGALAITQQPASTVVTAPAPATFSVAVNNPGSARYQWQISHDGGLTWSNLGAGGASYTTPATSTADNHTLFQVVVTDGTVTLTSTAAELSVVSGPVSLAGACINGPAGWCYQQPAPVANALTELVFDPATREAIVFGQSGLQMRSSDNGNTWSVGWDASRTAWVDVAQLASGTFAGVGSPSPASGPAGTRQSGVRGLYRSVDGGVSWTLAYASDDINFVAPLAFADANVGVAAAFFGFTADILRTTDGGVSWAPVHVPASLVTPGVGLTRMTYAGKDTGGADIFVGVGGSGAILRSADAGLTWSLIPSGTSDQLQDVAFGSSGFGIAVDNQQSQVLRTTDFGATWTVIPTQLANATSVAFADANTAVVFGQFGAVIRSTDGGASWSAPDSTLVSGQQNWRPRFSTSALGLAVGQYGAVARTLDGGVTWARIAGGRLDDSILDMAASPAGSGVILADTLGGVLRSTDAGLTWSGANQPLGSGVASWTSGTTVMDFGLFGNILRSDDAGATWSTVYTDATVNFRAGAMASTSTAIAAGATTVLPSLKGGVMRRTTDGGATWSDVANLPSTEWIYGARFLTPLVGLAGGENATLMRTTDGGATWNLVSWTPLVAGETVGQITRLSDSVAILSTDSEILRSGDGGSSWSPVFGLAYGVGGSSAFLDDKLGVAVGVSGLVLTTSDGGLTWAGQNVPIDYNLSAAAWAGANMPVIGGDGGAILRNTRSGILATTRANTAAVPAPRVAAAIIPSRAVVVSTPPRSVAARTAITRVRTARLAPVAQQSPATHQAVALQRSVDSQGRAAQGPANSGPMMTR